MKNRQAPTRLLIFLSFLILVNLILAELGSATGISVDAGLTPAENRWMFRSQIRFMERDNDPTAMAREMKMYMWPVVVAYGVRSDLTFMVRQATMRRKMTMGGNSSTNTGLTDLLLLGKYRLIRVNTQSYSFGIAPTLGLEIPSGEANFTSDTWDVRAGLFGSGRIGSWGVDLSTSYIWNGLAKTSGQVNDPGDEFSIESALAHQFSLGSSADFALAPVVEFSYQSTTADSYEGNDFANSGESVLLLSPGFKLTKSSFIFESLLQVPVWQDQNGLQTERAPTLLVGFRLMN